MSFGEVFSDIRRRRRIPMRLFNERAGVSPSYIHDIEQGALIPSPAKLEAISSVLREVASEQGADPDADVRELFRAREETVYVDRLHIDPRLAGIFIALRELDEETLSEIEEPLLAAIGFFRELDLPLQRGLSRTLLQTMAVVEAQGEGRTKLGMDIVRAVQKQIDRRTSVKSRAVKSPPATTAPRLP